MSKVQITYERAMAFCPVEAQQAIDNLKKSKSKFKSKDPKTLPWEFFWGEEIQGETVHDLFSGRSAKRRQAERAQTLAQKIDARKQRIIVSVCVKDYSAPLPRGIVPDEILSTVIECEEQAHADQQRADALTPEQRAAEVNRLLGELGGMGGIAVVQIP